LVQIDPGATWSLSGTVASQQTVAFSGAGDTLTLATPSAFSGAITNFATSDAIILSGVTQTTGLSLSSSNVLSVLSGTAVTATLQLDRALAINFAAVAGGTELTVACFAKGTRIAATDGQAAVETLRPGMAVRSFFGGCRPVVWIGHRTIDCTRHPRPQTVWPIQIQAGAFGRGLPAADLRLSPDHAVYVNDVLIPVRLLVNGTTIRQVPVDAITYYHVELPRHDVLLAEGLPAESYLDTGDRSNFSDGVPVGLFPDFSTPVPNLAAIWEAEGCAPLVVHGPVLDAARAAVNARILAAA
jgi:hypothetical protein